MKPAFAFLFVGGGLLLAQTPAAPTGPLAVVLAAGAPTTTPRHAAVAFGIAEPVSATQDFFLTFLLAPQPIDSAGRAVEQESIVLGITQNLGSMTFLGIPMKGWASAAFGTALSNAAKVNLSGTPSAAVASASTNAAFTAEYVFGFGYQPAWCSRCTMGPAGRYVHIAGQPSQVIVGWYLRWGPK